jgi:ureidoacrylate peracid hydrolase
MQTFTIPPEVRERLVRRQGRLHAYERIDPEHTASVVVDMQNYFVHPGYQGEVSASRETFGAINRLNRGLREAGGTVVWIQTDSSGADRSWSHNHGVLMTPERSARRLQELAAGSPGYDIAPEMEVHAQDLRVVKRRFSALIQGSSNLEAELRARGIDTVLVTGTATNVCCESTARDAMMLNFQTIMVCDGLSASSQREHQASLELFMLFFGDVLTVDDVLGRLAVAARN